MTLPVGQTAPGTQDQPISHVDITLCCLCEIGYIRNLPLPKVTIETADLNVSGANYVSECIGLILQDKRKT